MVGTGLAPVNGDATALGHVTETGDHATGTETGTEKGTASATGTETASAAGTGTGTEIAIGASGIATGTATGTEIPITIATDATGETRSASVSSWPAERGNDLRDDAHPAGGMLF